MAANLSKNGVTLMAAYKDVVDGKSDTNWALFTYEGDSNDIRLAEKGEGGLEEMVEELSSGKVMYAFCCVKDPNSGLPKYVLINWTGEGVKDSRKGVYANHVSSMANFLKGAHVTVNARAEEDVDPATILAKVAKASGVYFNFHRKTTEHNHVPRGPVGSVYRKTNAKDEIQKTDKDRFWAQTQKDEDVLQKESSKKVEEEKQRIEREKRELEERQAKERQKRDKEKSTQIIRTRSFQKTLEIEKKEREQQKTQVSVYKKINVRDEIQKTDRDHFWAQAQKEEEDRRKESRKRLEEEKQRWEREKRDLEERQTKEREKRVKEKGAQMNHNSFQKKQEMEKIRIMQQMTHTKEEKPRQNRIYQNTGIKIAESVQKANEAKLLISQRSFNPRDVFKQQNQQSPGLNNGASPTPQPGKLRSPFLSQNSSEGGAAPPEPKRLLSPLPPPVFCKAPCSLFTSTFPVGHVENAASPVRFDLSMASPSSRKYENDEPPVQPTDNIEDDWSDEFDDDDDDDEYDDFDGDEGREEALYEDLYEEVPPVEDHRLKARALYDYQAADHTEITFDPDDLITGIEMAGEGWWRGYAPNGHYGLFPANYVELLQQAPV